MTERKVPIQSLIDHIKTAVDVDPWAKEMAEELLKEQDDLGAELTNAVELIHKKNERIKELLKEQEAVRSEAVEPEMYCVGQDKYKFYRCPACKTAWYYKGNYCLGCGRKVKWK